MAKKIEYRCATMGLIVLLLAGCSSISQKNDAAVAAAQRKARAMKTEQVAQDQNKKPVEFNKGFFFGSGNKAPLSSHDKLPGKFRRAITLNTQPLYLYQLIDKIAAVAGYPVHLAPLLLQQQQQNKEQMQQGEMMKRQGVRLALEYRGSLSGLLDRVAAHFGISWRYRDGHVQFFKYDTRTFALNLLPGTVEDKSVITNQSDMGRSGGGGDTGGGTKAKSAQSVTAHQANDVWKSTLATIQNMLTKNGSVAGNEDAGTLTVLDTPRTLKRISAYIDSVNNAMRRQVAVTVRIYSLDINNTSQRGFNLGVVFQDIKKKFGLNLTGVAPQTSISDAANLSAAVLPSADKASAALGQWSGTKLLTNVLDQYGKTSLVTEGSGIAMQGQPLPIQVTKTVGYLASSSSTTSLSVGATSSLEPGQVTTGFSLIVTPRIMSNGNIIMQYALDLSNLNEIQTITSGEQKIQVPTVSSRRFIQRARLKSGSTLILAGYEQNAHGDHHSHGLASWFHGTDHSHQVLFVTLTANVI